jgi:hypothetical protein
MSATTRLALSQLGGRLSDPPPPGAFVDEELEGVPDLVRRYLRGSISPGTPMARSARFRMRGSVKLCGAWLPFRAQQVLAPLHGFVWCARVGGVLVGSDHYADGAGAMEWRLFGLIRVIRAEGPDVSRSSAGRAAAEAVWMPTAFLPRFGVRWCSPDAHHATARFSLDGVELAVHYTFDEDARVRSVALDRWSDPDGNGAWGPHRFEHELARYSAFDGLVIPSAGRGAWLTGPDGRIKDEFFRYEITDFHLVTSTSKEESWPL